ncbi:ROK family transcriptional regulator [Streptomyces sp. N2-109]|uniref:ROK family transcriptional regulator n=1 Tax=Streptomyces gossypii TaxID=2883101 RepID=A0ABT2JS08_9ACTN|nr:ROK family transcriptional regulator [Streptomyces gossypii]MCT2590493.1 ROK family transcriptional regulator [Streptomyces gossypii]
MGKQSPAHPGTPQVLRAMNDRAALDLLLTHGPLSRGRLGELTGLSKPTASQLLARLQTARLVITSGTSGGPATGTATGAGRPGPSAQLYAVNPRAAHVAALDVTTTGLHAAVADLTGRVVGTHEVPAPDRRSTAATPPPSTPELVVRAVDGATAAAGLLPTDLHRVVIGTPGAFDPGTGRLRYAAHLPGWHSPDLLDELAAALPMPLSFDNDVNLAAVAEMRGGAADGCEDFVLLWNEQGIGAALVIGGRLHRGRTGGAGEVGFLPVPHTPLVRDAARIGSGGFQELAGAGGVLRLARDLGLPYSPDAAPHEAAADLLRRAADAGTAGTADGPAAGPAGTGGTGPYDALLRGFATGTAIGLAAMVAVLDPQLIVLSGGVLAAGGEPLRELVRAELAELAVPRPRLVLGSVTAHPVLSGALESALAATRDEVFDTTHRPDPPPTRY